MDSLIGQALVRLVVGGAIAAIGWVTANISVLAGAIPDPLYSGTVITIIVAVLGFLAKLLGGATTPAEGSALGFAGSAVAPTKRSTWRTLLSI